MELKPHYFCSSTVLVIADDVVARGWGFSEC